MFAGIVAVLVAACSDVQSLQLGDVQRPASELRPVQTDAGAPVMVLDAGRQARSPPTSATPPAAPSADPAAPSGPNQPPLPATDAGALPSGRADAAVDGGAAADRDDEDDDDDSEESADRGRDGDGDDAGSSEGD